MISDDELRKLIPAHDDVPIRYPDALGHLTLADEELIDQLAKDYAAQHALATARAVWEVAIEDASAIAERFTGYMRGAAGGTAEERLIQVARAIRSIGSGEQT